MLVDTRRQEQDAQQGFSPEVQNKIVKAGDSVGWFGKLGFIFIVIITLGLFGVYWVGTRNNLQARQMKINEATSSIDVMLTNRKDTLVKLLDATKNHIKYEKSTLVEVTKLRSGSSADSSIIEKDAQINEIAKNINVAFEKYPDLKAGTTINKLFNTADYIEKELAAARRTYNSHVNAFNALIVQWPANVIAAWMNLNTFALFKASAEQRQDVNLAIEQ